MALRDRLEAGEDVLGRFWIAGTVERWEDGTPGLLQWSTNEGARLRLIPPHRGWPTDVGGPHIIVQGLTRENQPLTLLDAWPKTLSWRRELLEMRADTVVADDQVDVDDAWDGLAARTANLHEWLPLTGIEFTDHQVNKQGKLTRAGVSWTPPEALDVDLPEGLIRLGPTMSTAARAAPDWSIETNMEFIVQPTDARTLDDLRHQYLRPLLAFTVFAADRPDEATEMRVWRTNQVALPVLTRRRGLEPREWLTGSQFLFRAGDVDDVTACLKRWAELWKLAEDSIATFCSTIDDDETWGPRHVMDVVSSLWIYARRVRGIKKSGVSALLALRNELGEAAGPIPLTNFDVQLMVGSRNYYAHLSEPTFEGVTVDVIRRCMFETARRARAMMQACLLSDLGFSDDQASRLLEGHYQNWPLPKSAVPDLP